MNRRTTISFGMRNGAAKEMIAMKKNKVLLVAALVLGVLLAGLAYAQTAGYAENDAIARVTDTITHGNVRTVNVEIATALPDEPKQLPIYRVTDANASKYEAIAIAKEFNFGTEPKVISYPVQPGNALSLLKTKYLFKNGSCYIEIDASSRAVIYGNSDKMMKVSSNLPSESDAIKIAQKFLEEHGISVNNATVEAETIFLNKLDTSTNEILDKKPMMIQVRFKRYVDGMRVMGAGGEVIVTIGDDGEPVYFLKNWRALEPSGTTDVIPLSAAIDKLKRLEVKDVPITPIRSIEVIGINLGYYGDIPSEEQTAYKPVWVFDVKTPTSTEMIQLCVDAAT